MPKLGVNNSFCCYRGAKTGSSGPRACIGCKGVPLHVCATSLRCGGGCIATHTGVVCNGLDGTSSLDDIGGRRDNNSPCARAAPVTGHTIDCNNRIKFGLHTIYGSGVDMPMVCPFIHCRCCGPRRGNRNGRAVSLHGGMDV